ncbi:DUF4136 domain-containing protein [Marinoscillum sp.]|uniref:DUF4136 domain-containing protein n=1 Tax=Marinoscillum sp. TaxID=2024838 RepID=UPI003BAB6709
MIRFKTSVLLVIISLTFTQCSVSRYSVITDYDRDADFSTYETYYWSDEFQSENNKDPLFYNSLTKKRLKTAIESEMQGRGYVLDAFDPDLLINSRVLVEQKNTQQSNYSYSPYSWYYYPAMPSNTSTQSKQGGVIIELIDKDRRQLVWQGYAPEVLETDTREKQEEIRSAVAMIFSKYEHRNN